MRGLKRVLGFALAGALTVTALPAGGTAQTAKAAEIWQNLEETVYLVPSNASTFHDTNGDGFGEFEGWGTSLCWWANRLGYSEELTADAAKKFFSDEGLDMNIGRYNIGGGDNVGTEDDGSDFWHKTHIVRSDSAVPGYCVDVTPIEPGKDYSSYARVDEECGYAWNYNWDADKNQMNILKAAAKASGTDFIAEAFSNSPPYFMTVSGCSSGAEDSNQNNLREDSYNAFAAYMADVIVHWAKEGVINFQSATPMNEPDTNYWGANSNKQEGCHFSPGASQSKIITALAAELKKQKEASTDENVKKALEAIIFSASDETDIDKAITNYKSLSAEAKAVVTRIDTHTYSGSDRKGLSKTAKEAGMNLWMSEVDGAYTAGQGAGEMTAALGLAQRIMTDLNGLKSTAWILWNAVDSHADAANPWPESKNDFAQMSDLYKAVNLNQGYWGVAFGDHNKKEVALSKKYYGFGQFTRYIRPGAAIIGSTNSNTLITYNPTTKKAVIVAVNPTADDAVWKFDFRSFTGMGNSIQAIRSSGSLAKGENWKDVSDQANLKADAAKKNFTATLKANSITTFLVDNVTYDAQRDEFKETEVSTDDLTPISLTEGMVSGSEPWNNGADVPTKAIDGNFDSFFDGVENGWLQIDLGKIYRIDAVGYAPRKGYAGRCNQATFYGSNDNKKWTPLYTIKETPATGVITAKPVPVWATDSNYYRYIKYTVPDDGSSCCNIAEIALYGAQAELPKLIEDYEAKEKEHKFVDKTAFTQAVASAKTVGGNASEEDKTAAMASVVSAYDGLTIVPAEQEKWEYEYNTITGVKGAELYDIDGNRIQAHGGQIQKVKADYDYNGNGTIDADEHEFWYWIGEDKTNDYRPCPGVRAYISKDLYNWKDVGNVLKTVPNWEAFTTDSYFTSLYGALPQEEKEAVYGDLWTDDGAVNSGCVIERPKMLYNDKTKKYVIWFHADGQTPGSTGSNYAKAKAGVAIADSPYGPFKLLGSYLLNYDPNANHGFDNEVGGHVRDMNLFKDDDGTGYVIYSSDGNQTMHIAKLNSEYTNVIQPDNSKAVEGVDFTRNFIDQSREAPAMFKYHDKYYIITSGCTGWSPNRASYAVADNPMGPWKTMGDPCTDYASDYTYHTQSTCVFPVDAKNGKFIYMGDRWYNPEISVGAGAGGALKDSRYVWVPVEFLPGDKIALRRYSNWTLADLENKGTYQILSNLPKTASSLEDLKSNMPAKLKVKEDSGTEKEINVTWSGYPENGRILGNVTITGEIEDGRSITHTANIIDEKMIYFFDSGAKSDSDYVKEVKASLGSKLRNSQADQAYKVANGAGYASIMDTDIGIKDAGSDIWANGYYAMKDKNIEYVFELEAGTYTVATGYQEWWNTVRQMNITVKDGEKQLATQDFTLAADASDEQQTVTFTTEKETLVKVIIQKSEEGKKDPVLSWIALMQDEKTGELTDKKALNEAILKAEGIKEAIYTAVSCKVMKEAYQKALEAAYSQSADMISKAAEALNAAVSALVKVKDKLNEGINANKAEKAESEYTTATWKLYADALEKAQALAAEEEPRERDVNYAVKTLADAKRALCTKKESGSVSSGKSDPVISCDDEISKTYGDKAFDLDAEIAAGLGTLTYNSSDKKVAEISEEGKVTIRGTGICTITVSLAESEDYKASSEKITLTVKPKKITLSSITAAKGQGLTVKWKKADPVSGYEIQCASSKTFKSGLKKATAKGSAASAVVKNLVKGKKYYVRARAYKQAKVNGKTVNVYGDWSKGKISPKVTR